MSDLPTEVSVRVKDGHDLRDDHPAHVSALRWMCATCGEGVMQYSGDVYGGATEKSCTDWQAHWRAWEARYGS